MLAWDNDWWRGESSVGSGRGMMVWGREGVNGVSGR